MPPRRIQIINRTVVTLRDLQFPHGYEQGYKAFQQGHRDSVLSELEIYWIITNAVPTTSAEWSAGFVTGWFAALFDSFPDERFSVAQVMDGCDTTE